MEKYYNSNGLPQLSVTVAREGEGNGSDAKICLQNSYWTGKGFINWIEILALGIMDYLNYRS